MGNLLKEGGDYGDTFATTVSTDGLRWFCSLACSAGKEVKGWDATTGYLQSKQRISVYAYIPLHHEYFCLSYEELARERAELLNLVEKERRERITTTQLAQETGVAAIPQSSSIAKVISLRYS